VPINDETIHDTTGFLKGVYGKLAVSGITRVLAVTAKIGEQVAKARSGS